MPISVLSILSGAIWLLIWKGRQRPVSHSRQLATSCKKNGSRRPGKAPPDQARQDKASTTSRGRREAEKGRRSANSISTRCRSFGLSFSSLFFSLLFLYLHVSVSAYFVVCGCRPVSHISKRM